jgi:hypothetical protein
MKSINRRPKTPGYYWYQDGLTDYNWIVLRVVQDDKRLCASDEEFVFDFTPGETPEDPDEKWSDKPIPKPK